MKNAVVEKQGPAQEGATESPEGIRITTELNRKARQDVEDALEEAGVQPDELNRKARQDVEDALEEAGVQPEGKGLGVTPSMEKPVLTADLAKEVGAVNVGHEEPEFEPEQRDARNLFKVIRSYFTGESIWGRLGSTGKRWIKVLKRKKVEESKPENRYDPAQSEI